MPADGKKEAAAAAPSVDLAMPDADQVDRIPLGERWIPDAFQLFPCPGGTASRMVDMTQGKVAVQVLRESGIRATFTHLIVRAAALALARNPDLHQLVCDYRRLTPGNVDIGLSMAGQTTYAPVVVLPASNRKPLCELVPFIEQSIAAARAKEIHDLANIRRTGWVIPFGFLRRFFLRWFNKWFWFRRRLVGTFQVSCLPNVDILSSFLFYTGSILCAGSIRDRVLAIDGQAVVRPTVWLTVVVDHIAMDGLRAAKLIQAVKTVLEGDELVLEARAALSSKEPQASRSTDGMSK